MSHKFRLSFFPTRYITGHVVGGNDSELSRFDVVRGWESFSLSPKIHCDGWKRQEILPSITRGIIRFSKEIH